MRRLNILLALIITIIGSTGLVKAYDLEGIIFDYDRKPLVDALVSLLSVQRDEVGREYTNKNGEYRIRNIAAGLYTMEISKMGMKKVTMEVSVGGPLYQSTIYKDIYLNELIRFESVKPSELKGLYITESETMPLTAFSNYLKGVKKLEKKKYKAALKEFNKAIKRYPEFSRCYTHIGEIKAIQGKIEEAKTALSKAIELNNRDPFPLTALGRLLVDQSDYVEAIPFLRNATEMDSARAENHFLLGKALYHTNHSTDAEKCILQGLMIQPRESGDARIILADIYFAQKRYSESRNMLDAYLRDNPFAENKLQIRKRIEEMEMLLNPSGKEISGQSRSSD
ncbi:tetratricopeptide repeat protein [bacterium]|nr:tetratricopeptide repeat protein [candidate division CSSED10-310 bacterium]